MDYLSLALRLASFVSAKPDSIDYSVILPATIDAAEQRIYRDLDLLSTVIRNSSASLTAGSRNFALPTNLGTYITVQSVNVVTPAGATADGGTRNQLMPVSRDFLDSVWNSSLGSTLPLYFAMIDNANIIVGPWPDSAYKVEVVGTIRPTPLSESNPTTFLTLYLPDLFLSAAMTFFARAAIEFGAQTQGSVEYWAASYEALKQSAMTEELRRKFANGDWSSLSVPVS